MKKRERIIENCFNSWIVKDFDAFCESFADDAIYIESWGPAYRNIEQLPNHECLFGCIFTCIHTASL